MTPASPPHGVVACAQCNLRELCLPSGLKPDEMARLGHVVSAKRQVRRRGALFRQGDPFTSIYAVRYGVFKTCLQSANGAEQVTGFHLAGELLGMEGIAHGRHTCDAIALENAEVCVMPFDSVAELAREIEGVQCQLHRVMSREIVRDQRLMLLLGNMSAEDRVAAFLFNLLQRMEARGFSGSELNLRMSRQDIGSYLGLTLETVSRTFARFASQGLLDVQRRHIRIRDAEVRALWQRDLATRI
jgi:CRP/FNR family transcriptional regulator